MTGLFSINSPEKLYESLSNRIENFMTSPSEEGIFDVIFHLYHLREWISPKSRNNDSTKDKPEEKVSSYLHQMKEFQIIRDMCNNAKHFDAKNKDHQYAAMEGFRAGYGRAGDRLDVSHLLIDGIEIRDIFSNVFDVYREYFKSTNPV